MGKDCTFLAEGSTQLRTSKKSIELTAGKRESAKEVPRAERISTEEKQDPMSTLLYPAHWGILIPGHETSPFGMKVSTSGTKPDMPWKSKEGQFARGTPSGCKKNFFSPDKTGSMSQG